MNTIDMVLTLLDTLLVNISTIVRDRWEVPRQLGGAPRKIKGYFSRSSGDRFYVFIVPKSNWEYFGTTLCLFGIISMVKVTSKIAEDRAIM